MTLNGTLTLVDHLSNHVTGSGISMTGRPPTPGTEWFSMSHPVVFFLVCGWVSYSCIIVTFDQSGIWLLAKDTFLTNQRPENLGELSDFSFFIFINVIFLRVKSVES